MNVLITGVAGHIGCRMADWILHNVPGARVLGIDDLSCGYRSNIPLDVEFRQKDVANISHEEVADMDVVFHFAAYAAECMSPFVRRYNYVNNVASYTALINALINTGFDGRLVFTSSMAVYGKAPTPMNEDMHCVPYDPYGVAKLAVEYDIRIAGEQHDIDWCIIRPHNVYGPYQSLWQRYRNVFGLWMRALLEGRPIRVFGDGFQMRAFSYIDDILPCLWRAAVDEKASRQIINLGGSTPISINEAAHTMLDVFGKGARIEYAPPRHEVKRAWCTTAKSEALLGYADKTPLYQGLMHMWAWAKIAWQMYPGRRTQPDVFGFECEKGMPESWKQKDS